MKRVKVMMSSYNGEKYIEKQIKSILAQEDVNIELYIRDDGSKDATVSIINNLASVYPNIHIECAENIGPSDSFMNLLYTQDDSGENDYFAFSDQDDLWEKDKLSRAVDFLEDITTPALYYSALLTFQEDTGKQKLVVNEREYSFEETFIQSHYPGCTMVMNRAGMELIHSIRKPEDVIMHDLFLTQVFMGTDNIILYDKESKINYRIHGNNVSVKKNSLFGEIKRYKKIIDKQRGLRLAAARAYKEVMEERLDSNKRETLDIITGYRSSFRKRWAMIRMIRRAGFGRRIKCLFTFAVMTSFY